MSELTELRTEIINQVEKIHLEIEGSKDVLRKFVLAAQAGALSKLVVAINSVKQKETL